MPIYEYRCEDCGHRFDAIRPVQEREVPCTCPRCASTRSRVLFSASFRLVHGAPGRGPSASGTVTDAASGEHPRSTDVVEQRPPLPEHWSRYPRNLNEAI
jgi:putative FmdB family regulatory protein